MTKTSKTNNTKALKASAAAAKAIALADAQSILTLSMGETRELFDAFTLQINSKLPAEMRGDYLKAYEKLSTSIHVMFACDFKFENLKKVFKALADKDVGNIKFLNSVKRKDEEDKVDWIIRVLGFIVTKNDACNKALAASMNERTIVHITRTNSDPTTPIGRKLLYAKSSRQILHESPVLGRTRSIQTPRSPHKSP